MGAPQTPLVVRSGPKAGDPSWSSTVLKETREREDNGSVESAASGQQQQQQLTGKCWMADIDQLLYGIMVPSSLLDPHHAARVCPAHFGGVCWCLLLP
jgi:hypothetical protein